MFMFNYRTQTFGSILLMLIIMSITASAQVSASFEGTKESSPFRLTLGGGITAPYTDVPGGKTEPVLEFDGGYSLLPYLQISVGMQKGLLSAGENEGDHWYFKNNYWSEHLMLRFLPKSLFRKSKKKETKVSLLDFYAGAGIGLLQNYTIARLAVGPNSGPENYQGNVVIVPVEIGANFPIAELTSPFAVKEKYLLLNINIRYYFTFSDKIDGYKPTVDHNEHNDAFSTATIGLVYVF